MNFCSITSGSSGNCIYVGSEHASLLVDVGLSGKRIEAGLNSIDRKTAEMDGILITHEHSDHIKAWEFSPENIRYQSMQPAQPLRQ